MLIYIIIGRETCFPKHFRAQIPGEMCRVTLPEENKTPKRYRKRCRFPEITKNRTALAQAVLLLVISGNYQEQNRLCKGGKG